MNLISVIVPIYNSEKYLERCILSIINQEYKNLELIAYNAEKSDLTEACIGIGIQNGIIHLV